MLFKHFTQEQQVAIRRRQNLKRYLKFLNLSVTKLICDEVVRCQPASLRRKLFHASSFMYFTFYFSGCITITSSEEGLKMCWYNFFQRKVVLLVIFLFSHDLSKTHNLSMSTIFMLNMAFDVLLSVVFAKCSKLESFVSRNVKLFALCFYMYFFY